MSELEQSEELRSIAGAPRSTLYYGPAGSGKTTLFLHRRNAEGKLTRKFLIDVDNKVREIENLPHDVRESCKVWSCTAPVGSADKIAEATKTSPPIPNMPEGLRRTINVINELLEIARKCSREKTLFPFDDIGLDSFSAVSDHIISKVAYDNNQAFLSVRNWGLVSQNQLVVLRGFLQLPCERIVIAHDKHVTIRDTDTGEIKQEFIRPNIPGGLGDDFARYFTEVYYFRGRQRSGDYKIQTVKDNLLTARTGRDIPAEIIIDQKTKQLVLKS